MQSQYTVLFYSKYSQFCKKIIKSIEDSNIDFNKLKGLTLVCIDNDDIRAQILKSNSIDIKSVPCLITIYNDGGIEKYEGEDSFKWVEDVIVKNTPKVEVPVEPVIQQPPPMPMPPPQQQQTQIMEKNISPEPQEFLDDEEDEYIPEPIPEKKRRLPPQQHIPENIPTKIKKANIQKINNLTPIEDIEDEDFEEEYENNIEIETVDIFPPKQASLRTGAGTYEINGEFGKKNNNSTKITKVVKSSVPEIPGKKGRKDIMSTALEMQKLREKEDESLSRPPFSK